VLDCRQIIRNMMSIFTQYGNHTINAKPMHFAALCLTKGLNMDKSEILYGIVCVIVFALIGVMLAWRG